jgi:hypothetical protein
MSHQLLVVRWEVAVYNSYLSTSSQDMSVTHEMKLRFKASGQMWVLAVNIPGTSHWVNVTTDISEYN